MEQRYSSHEDVHYFELLDSFLLNAAQRNKFNDDSNSEL